MHSVRRPESRGQQTIRAITTPSKDAGQRLRERPDQFRTVLCLTGQHRSLVDDVVAMWGCRSTTTST